MSTLTKEKKAEIDALPYRELLYRVRFSPLGSPDFTGEVGEYFLKRMEELRSAPGGNEMHVAASKSIGWER